MIRLGGRELNFSFSFRRQKMVGNVRGLTKNALDTSPLSTTASGLLPGAMLLRCPRLRAQGCASAEN